MNRNFKQARYYRQWISDPQGAVRRLLQEIEKLQLFKPTLLTLKTGDVLFREKARNKFIYLVVDGEVGLFKNFEQDGSVQVTTVKYGSMIGVMSFFSGQKAISSAVALTDAVVWGLSKEEVELLMDSDLDIAGMSRQLLISNLMERYSQVVELNGALHTLNRELDEERKHLDDALTRLRNAHERLVHQEKMATLGQLVAGLAHEINNPAAALINASEHLSSVLSDLFSGSGASEDTGSKGSDILTREVVKGAGYMNSLAILFFEGGLGSEVLTSERMRERTELLKGSFPGVKSSELRRLAGLSDAVIGEAEVLFREGGSEGLGVMLRYAEAGLLVRRIRISSDRISGLVRSLKRYSRHESTGTGVTDISEGISDTIQILGNRLKNIELSLELDSDLPKVKADSGELNQVWTNILVNACDALNDKGRIKITATTRNHKVLICIADDGPGIPVNLRDKIFLPHFTTRNSSGNFGLGLGLSITRELVYRNGGTIEVSESSWGGAEFRITLMSIE